MRDTKESIRLLRRLLLRIMMGTRKRHQMGSLEGHHRNILQDMGHQLMEGINNLEKVIHHQVAMEDHHQLILLMANLLEGHHQDIHLKITLTNHNLFQEATHHKMVSNLQTNIPATISNHLVTSIEDKHIKRSKKKISEMNIS